MSEFSVCEGWDATLSVPTVELFPVAFFDAAQTFDCGQCFRFDRIADGSYEGVAFGRCLRIRQEGARLTLVGANRADYETIWRSFLGLDEDYGMIRDDIGMHFGLYGNTIYEAMACASGIRILRGEPWEALCSFILSQNNNIPRIKKIIGNMAEGLGEPITAFGKTYYAFPCAETICRAGIEGLAPYRMGFRARYVLDAAEKYRQGELDFDALRVAPYEQTEKVLMSICGVGKKVASCAMLYGLHRTEAFPVDVWMRRVLDKYYPDGLDLSSLGPYAGIAQQYLFFYEREKSSQEREKKRA